jgi:hypothetical protein
MHRAQRILQGLLILSAAAIATPAALAQQQKQLPQKQAAQKQCPSIRAADGSCADPGLVAAANKRATIVSSGFASYIGTPHGTLGLGFIPHERLFRDDPVVFGLPTNTDVKVDDLSVTTTTRSK